MILFKHLLFSSLNKEIQVKHKVQIKNACTYFLSEFRKILLSVICVHFLIEAKIKIFLKNRFFVFVKPELRSFRSFNRMKITYSKKSR